METTYQFSITIAVFNGLLMTKVLTQGCENYTIEKGSFQTIPCDTTGNRKTFAAYWYKGDLFSSCPILQFVNGTFGGSETNKDHFEIDFSGAMTIRNATVGHEALYSCASFYQDDEYFGRSVTVNITVTPNTSCPTIAGCSSCEVCNNSVKDNGILECSLTRIRPLMTLKWIVESKNGIEANLYSPSEEYDSSTGTWNTSVTLSYNISSCKQDAVFRCLCQDHHTLLRQPSSLVKIETNSCDNHTLVRYRLTFLTCIVLVLVAYIFRRRIMSFQHSDMSSTSNCTDDAKTNVLKKKKTFQLSDMSSTSNHTDDAKTNVSKKKKINSGEHQDRDNQLTSESATPVRSLRSPRMTFRTADLSPSQSTRSQSWKGGYYLRERKRS